MHYLTSPQRGRDIADRIYPPRQQALAISLSGTRRTADIWCNELEARNYIWAVASSSTARGQQPNGWGGRILARYHPAMVNRWSSVTIDCADPARLARFWSALLDRPLTAEHDGPDWATLGSRTDQVPRLTFQRVPEAKRGKVRLHLDVQVDDIDAGRIQVEHLGGQWTGQRHDYPGEGVVLVMTDPEGHEFCIVHYL